MRDRLALLWLAVTVGSVVLGFVLEALFGGGIRAPDVFTLLAVSGVVLLLLAAGRTALPCGYRFARNQRPCFGEPSVAADIFWLFSVVAYAALLMWFDPFLFLGNSAEEAALVVISFIPFVVALRPFVAGLRLQAIAGVSLFMVAHTAIILESTRLGGCGRGFLSYWRS